MYYQENYAQDLTSNTNLDMFEIFSKGFFNPSIHVFMYLSTQVTKVY